jgi:parallel beta-helix repeat protein
MQEKMNMQNMAGFFNTTDQWQPLGPRPVNSYNTSAGRVSCIAYDKRYSDGSVIFLGSCGGGVWKSIDGGLTWVPKTDDKEALACGSIAIDPNLTGTHSIIYVATGEGVWFGGFPYTGCGVLKSTDGGETWILKRNGLPYRTYSYKIAISPVNPQLLFLAVRGGLYKSTDAGENWIKVLPVDPNTYRECTSVAFSPDGNRVYAIGPFENYFYPGIDGYYVSTDGGSNFTHTYVTNHEIRRSHVVVCKNEPQYVYILFDSYNNGTCSFLYKSTDGGLTYDNGTQLRGGGGNASYNLLLAVKPNDHNTIYFGLSNLYKSQDWGSTWCCVGSVGYTGCDNPCSSGSTPHPDFHALDFNPSSPDKIIVGCDGGVYKSDNEGYTWNTYMNSSMTLTQFYSMTSFPFNENQLVGGTQDHGMLKKNSDLSWTVSMGGDGGNSVCSETRANNMMANMCGSGSGVYYSLDGGTSYPYPGSIMPGISPNGLALVVSHPYEPGVYYALRNHEPTGPPWIPSFLWILKSTNDGVSFTDYSTGPTSYEAQRFAMSKSNPNIMYMTVGKVSDEWHTPNHVYKYDLGAPPENQWRDLFIYHSGTVPDKDFSAIAIDPLDENNIYLGLSGFQCDHLWKSSNGGINWINVSRDLPDGPVNDILIYYPDENTRNILVASDGGVYISSNEGASWQEFGDKLPNALAIKMFYNRLQCKLRVCTMGRGVWEIPVRGPIIVKDNLVISSDDGGTKINEDIIVCPGGKITFIKDPRYNSPKLLFAENKKIFVKNGGQIDFANADNLVLTSQSGNWGGIEFDYGGYGSLNNCNFQNTGTAVMVDYSVATGSPIGPGNSIEINNCTFNNCSVQVNSDNDMNVYIENSTFNGCNYYGNGAIGLNYSDPVLVTWNVINNCTTGIAVSNSSAEISNNTTNNCGFGITLDECYAPNVKSNIINGYDQGIYMFNSSPIMLRNTFNTSSQSDICIYSNYLSFPRMRPSSGDGVIIWDAGINFLNADPSTGIGIYFMEGSGDLNLGINFVNAGYFYLAGFMYPIPKNNIYYATNNCWDGGNTNESKFYLPDIEVAHIPDNCIIPLFSVFQKEGDFHEVLTSNLDVNKAAGNISEIQDVSLFDPIPPYIIDLGNGHYDTIRVTNGNLNLSPNEMLYSLGIKKELNDDLYGAMNIYKEIVRNYKDSVTSIKAIIRMLPCTDKMKSDTGRYTSLENYYMNLIQSSVTDTAFSKVANELAHKVLVRQTQYAPAITAYENDIQNTSDSLEILCCQPNIVETYMLFSQNGGGNTPQFTGKYKELKPSSKQDGFRMINDLLHHIKLQNKTKIIPKEFKLSQNYPNPFNPITKIEYSLPQNTKVSIKVYDILGRIVKVLVDEFKEAGIYTINFDGSNYASGVYFYRIEAGKFVNTKKMVLVK